MSLGNSYPTRSSVPNTEIIRGIWTGGGAASNCTKAAADWSRGIKSIAYNAATGKYLVTLVDGGQQIVGGGIEFNGPAGATKKFVHVIRSTYSPSAKTVQIEVWTQGTHLVDPALVDLATTETLMCEFVMVTNKPAS